MECITSYGSDDSECDDNVKTVSTAEIHVVGDSLSPPSVACNAHACMYCRREFHGDPEANLCIVCDEMHKSIPSDDRFALLREAFEDHALYHFDIDWGKIRLSKPLREEDVTSLKVWVIYDDSAPHPYETSLNNASLVSLNDEKKAKRQRTQACRRSPVSGGSNSPKKARANRASTAPSTSSSSSSSSSSSTFSSGGVGDVRVGQRVFVRWTGELYFAGGAEDVKSHKLPAEIAQVLNKDKVKAQHLREPGWDENVMKSWTEEWGEASIDSCLFQNDKPRGSPKCRSNKIEGSALACQLNKKVCNALFEKLTDIKSEKWPTIRAAGERPHHCVRKSRSLHSGGVKQSCVKPFICWLADERR